MGAKTARPMAWVCFVLAIGVVLGLGGCASLLSVGPGPVAQVTPRTNPGTAGGTAGGTVTGEATVTSSDTSQTKPKAGTWRARFTVETSQKTETWVIEFGISDDGRRVATIQFAHYAGEMTPGTSVWLMAPNTVIENSSFPFSLMEYVGSSQRNHKGQVTFTSATTATGTITIAGKDYQFTATP